MRFQGVFAASIRTGLNRLKRTLYWKHLLMVW
jgi:hypothetical protein